jgi:hypothetical protein
MNIDEKESAENTIILERTRFPGTLLIWVGILNAFGGLIFLQAAIRTWRMPMEQVQEELKEDLQKLEKFGWKFLEIPGEDLQRARMQFFFGWAAAAMAGAFIIGYAGYNLRTLNSYRLALCGAILAGLPWVSPMGCCGIGQLAGIWSLVVLFNREVRSAFP